jgi:peroxiredoxin (alkyl hydroperoxide reductase subunit C)
MAKPFKAGCSRPKSTVNMAQEKTNEKNEDLKKEEKIMVQVGKPAPNFELAGYHKGEFKTFTLEEFKGKWVLLCFYPGDFTFV